jgi:hypothetical protein
MTPNGTSQQFLDWQNLDFGYPFVTHYPLVIQSFDFLHTL